MEDLHAKSGEFLGAFRNLQQSRRVADAEELGTKSELPKADFFIRFIRQALDVIASLEGLWMDSRKDTARRLMRPCNMQHVQHATLMTTR